MTRLLPFFLLLPACVGANLAYSTFLKDGFTPAAITADAQGNIYMTGSAGTSRAVVAKVDPQGSRYLYFTTLDAADYTAGITVDSAGNAYITGSTSSPTFAVTVSALSPSLATPPAGPGDSRSFVIKLDPKGTITSSVLLGGATPNSAESIALTPQGQILVSGLASAEGFPTTAGAYSVPDSSRRWFLIELDATANHLIFSATGIGGSSLAVDAAGNIYMAGNSLSDYPTTPGAYQSQISLPFFCAEPCQIIYPGGVHVTKTDATASKLIYSTGVPLVAAFSAHTLALDSSGDVYVAGSTNRLIKLDSTGSTALFSAPAGGIGVQIGASGAVYASGIVLGPQIPDFELPIKPAPPPATFSWVPQACWPNNVVATAEAFVVKVDPDTGGVLDGQWIDGSAPTVADMVVVGDTVWVAGGTPAADVPYTPGALAPVNVPPGVFYGGFLSAADFSKPAAGPVIACVLDQGNMTHVGAVAPGQLISLFGVNLDGASLSFDGVPAPPMYGSSSQINVAVPVSVTSTTVMQISVNGGSTVRQFPVTPSNLNLFADLSKGSMCGTSSTDLGFGFGPLVTNADGSLNSCANPAKDGSLVSFYMHGAGISFSKDALTVELKRPCDLGLRTTLVEQAGPLNAYVDKADVRLSSSFASCSGNTPSSSPESVLFSYGGKVSGPFSLPGSATSGQYMPLIVWVAP